jgi:predicted O-methyltransferase YrrM
MELDLFSKLAEKPMTIEELKDSLGIASRPVKTLAIACTALGLLNKVSNKFHNSSLAERFLVRGKPDSLDSAVIIHPRMWRGIERLKEAVLNDAPTAVQGHQGFYQDLSFQEWAGFAQTMDRQSLEATTRLMEFFDFSRARRILDIGGGLGSYSIAVLTRYPHITAILFDLPAMCALTKEFVKKHDLGSRIKIYRGDFLVDELPHEADVILLSKVLHDHSVPQCKSLLGKCFELLPRSGYIIVHEEMLNEDETGPPWPALLSVCLLAMFNGAEVRSVSENCALLRDTGFTEIRTSRVGEMSTFISARKP